MRRYAGIMYPTRKSIENAGLLGARANKLQVMIIVSEKAGEGELTKILKRYQQTPEPETNGVLSCCRSY